jgi:hypothetical protein
MPERKASVRCYSRPEKGLGYIAVPVKQSNEAEACSK